MNVIARKFIPLIATVTDWNNRVTTYQYDRLGRLIGITRPNGTTAALARDAADQLNSIRETSGEKLISYLRFDFDAASQIDRRFRAPLVQSGWQHPTFTGTYDDDNRLATVNGQAVTHDADGNMTNGPIRQDSGHLNLTYNSRNQLTSADGLSYTYGAEGVRRTTTTSTTTSSGTTRDVTDPNSAMSRLLVRHHPDGSKTYYVYGLGLLYEVDQAEQTKTYHYDQVGSTIVRTNDSGAVIGKAEYSAYGICFWKQGDMATPFQYNGQWGIQTDANGLLNMRARYYSPYLMRFLNADPIGFSGGSNWFAYADGNPISNNDPFGLWSWNQTWGVVKALGGIAEVAVGVSIGAATSWTGVGAVAGGAVALHGIDTIQAGFRQAITGNEVDSLTSQAIQSTGVSRSTSNLVDAGLGLASGVGGIANGASRIPQMLNTGRAAGVTNPLRTAYYYEKGSSALLTDDFIALGGRNTSAVEKGISLSNGFETSTNMLQGLGKGFTLFPKPASAGGGLTPLGDIFFGGAAAASRYK